MVDVNRAERALVGLNEITDRFFPEREDTVTADNNRPAARVYEGLQGGPNWSRTYETQTGVPIDGSSALARDPRFGSPFTFRVLPAEILVNSILEGSDSSTGVSIIEAAQRADTSFSDYTTKLDRLRDSADVVRNEKTFNLLDNFIAEGQIITPQNLDDPRNLIPAISDLRQAADVLLQLTRMLNTPPLTLLINPQSLTINHAKKQNYSDRSRSNYIFQSWGEEQVKLSVAARIGAFMAGDSPTQFFAARGTRAQQIVETSTATGVQWASKRNSASWQNFLNLMLFYRNNGYIYDTVTRSEAHYWIGSVAIDYDQFTYVGNFDSLDFSYEENKQNGGIDFNFEFTANRIYDNAQGVNFFVESIDSPVPSPSDSRWSRPQTQPRQGNIFDAFTITKRPDSGPFGDNPFGGNNRPAPTSAGFFTRGNTGAARRGRVRGGDF